LVLSGGGARGAYQAGVVRAIAEISRNAGLKRPFPVLTGVSAGAVNAAFLASRANDFFVASERMMDLWSTSRAEDVFKTDAVNASWLGLKFISDATLGAFYRKKLARSLLNTSPLYSFIERSIEFENIPKHLEQGCFDALAITAMNYTSSNSITFVQGTSETPLWTRSRRRAEFAKIGTDHVMASAAIPLFFPPVRVGEDHFGDGCLRNTAPLSPAIHLGADRLLVISVRRPDSRAAPQDKNIEPSMARILGVILNALLLDAVDVDMERMSRVNLTLDSVPEKRRTELQLRKLDYLWIRPSEDIGHMAGDLFDHLPAVIRYLIKGLGSSREASELTSYLLFDPVFCGRLVKLGYEDGMAREPEIHSFLTGEPPPAAV
jgi:NTE family protein